MLSWLTTPYTCCTSDHVTKSSIFCDLLPGKLSWPTLMYGVVSPDSAYLFGVYKNMPCKHDSIDIPTTGALNLTLLLSFFAWPSCGYLVKLTSRSEGSRSRPSWTCYESALNVDLWLPLRSGYTLLCMECCAKYTIYTIICSVKIFKAVLPNSKSVQCLVMLLGLVCDECY